MSQVGMRDARGPTWRGAAALASVLPFGCLPGADLSDYSRGPASAGAGGADVAQGGAGQGGATQGAAQGGAAQGGAAQGGASSSAGASGAEGSGTPAPPVASGGTGTDTTDGGAPDTGSGGTPIRTCGGGVLAPDNLTCYFMSTAARNWRDARQSCEDAGQTLVQVSSAEEDDFVAGLSRANLWIGASDLQVDGRFIWSDGSPIVFANWGPAQPDDYVGPDCVEKRQEQGEAWYDQPCGDTKLFVCERPFE